MARRVARRVTPRLLRLFGEVCTSACLVKAQPHHVYLADPREEHSAFWVDHRFVQELAPMCVEIAVGLVEC